jgi:hypothetical protein
MPLKRAAQSFSFTVPTKEFINKPVQTLFSGTVQEESSDASSSRHRPGNRTIKSFASCEYNPLFVGDVYIANHQADDDDIQQARMMTQPTVQDLAK